MTDTKWTPGPWFLINDHCVGGPIEPGWEEAGCGIAHCGMRARTPEEAAANAHLIAAAPDLYEALRQARGMLNSCGFEEPDEELEASWENALNKVDAALAKARGEQP